MISVLNKNLSKSILDRLIGILVSEVISILSNMPNIRSFKSFPSLSNGFPFSLPFLLSPHPTQPILSYILSFPISSLQNTIKLI